MLKYLDYKNYILTIILAGLGFQGCGGTLIETIQTSSLKETNELLDEKILASQGGRLRPRMYLSEPVLKKDRLSGHYKIKDILTIAIDKGYEDLAIKIIKNKIMPSRYEHKEYVISKVISKKMYKLIKTLHLSGWISTNFGKAKDSGTVQGYKKFLQNGDERIANYFFKYVNSFRYSVNSNYKLDLLKVKSFKELIDFVIKNKPISFNYFLDELLRKNIIKGFSGDENLIMTMLEHLLATNHETEAILLAQKITEIDAIAEYHDVENKFLKPSLKNKKVFNILYGFYSNPENKNHIRESASLELLLRMTLLSNSTHFLETYIESRGLNNLSTFLDSDLLLNSIDEGKYIIINYLISKNIDFSEANRVLMTILKSNDNILISKINKIEKLPKSFDLWQKHALPFIEVLDWEKANFDLEESLVWLDAGFNLKTAKKWANFLPTTFIPLKRHLYILLLGKYKGSGVNDAERAVLYMLHETSLKKAQSIEKSIHKRCNKRVLAHAELKTMNPYATKGKCFWLEARRNETISKNRGLYSYRNLLVDLTFSGYAEGNFIGIIKGSGVTMSTYGEKIVKAKVIEILK